MSWTLETQMESRFLVAPDVTIIAYHAIVVVVVVVVVVVFVLSLSLVACIFFLPFDSQVLSNILRDSIRVLGSSWGLCNLGMENFDQPHDWEKKKKSPVGV